jgi:hypothetical protein
MDIIVRMRLVFLVAVTLLLVSCGAGEKSSDDDVSETSDVAPDTGDEPDSAAPDIAEPDTTEPDTGPKGKPADKYACNINAEGYCIFTGSPHINGLKAGTDDIVDRDGNVLFSVSDAVAVNAAGQVLQAGVGKSKY